MFNTLETKSWIGIVPLKRFSWQLDKNSISIHTFLIMNMQWQNWPILITWPSLKAGQVLKCKVFYFSFITSFFFFLGGGGEMVFGWICSGDLLRHLGKAYAKYCSFSSPMRAECFQVCFHCPSEWHCYHNFGPLVSHMNLHAGCRRSWWIFLEQFWLRWFSPLCTYWSQVYWQNASLVHDRLPTAISIQTIDPILLSYEEH